VVIPLNQISISQTLSLLRTMSQISADPAAPAQPAADPTAAQMPSWSAPEGALPADLPVMVPASMAETNPGLSLAGLRPPLATSAGQPAFSSTSSGQTSSSPTASNQASSGKSDAIAQLLEALGRPQGAGEAGGADAAGKGPIVVPPGSALAEGGIASRPEQTAVLASIQAGQTEASVPETALQLSSAQAAAAANDRSSAAAAEQRADTSPSAAASQQTTGAETSADGSPQTADVHAASTPQTPDDGQRGGPAETGRQADLADAPARTATAIALAPERGGIIASFILNAGMLPVRPLPLMAGAETEAAMAGKARQPPPNDEEALQYLVNLGANPALVEKMRKMLRRRTMGKKLMLFLASLMTALTVVTEALHRELASLAEEEQEKEDREAADPHGRSDGRHRLYLE